MQFAHDLAHKIIRRCDRAAIHDDDAVLRPFIAAFLRCGAQPALNLAQERGLTDAADAHDGKVARAALQDAAQLQVATEEARAADRFACFVGRQEAERHLLAEAVEQLASGAP